MEEPDLAVGTPGGDAEPRRRVAGMTGDGADSERESTITAGATEAL